MTMEQQLDFFDAFAPAYDGWAGGLHVKVAARLVEAAGAQRRQHVLDVGTGTGLVANGIARSVGRAGQVMGIDLSEAMLAQARRAARQPATFAGMAAEALVFRDLAFDLVTMGDVLTYCADPPRALAEARRVLRQGGRLALSVPRRSLATEAQETFFAVLGDFLRRHPLRIWQHGGERSALGEPDVLSDLLQDFGFEAITSSNFVTGWRLQGGAAWIDHLRGAGPYTHASLTALGPQLRARLASELDLAMAPLGEEAQRAHHGYTIATAIKR